MASRPNHIDLGHRPFDLSRNATPSPGDLPSPRSGDVPPALSPLDAFALQGRLLAQRLEAENANGRRVSRLPPLTIANALAQGRPGYHPTQPTQGNAATTNDSRRSPVSAGSEVSGNRNEVSQPQWRPKSLYPSIQAFDDAESITSADSRPTIRQVREPDRRHDRLPQPGYFAMGRASPFLPDLSVQLESSAEDSPPRGVKKSSTSDSLQSNTSHTLALPRSPGAPRSPRLATDQWGIRPVRSDGADDPGASSTHGPPTEYRLDERKTSVGSNLSRARSPFSPIFAPPRSPSNTSDHSLPARASVNFSRPMSRAERPSFEGRRSFEGSMLSLESPPLRPSTDVLSLQESIMDSPRIPTVPWVDAGTPLSLTDDESSPRGGPFSGIKSYVNAKYSLPRGRPLSRGSTQPQDGQSRDRSGARLEDASKPTIIQVEHDASRHDLGNGLVREGKESTDSAPPEFPPIVRTLSADDSAATTKPIRSHKSNPSFPPASLTNSSASSSRTLRAGMLPSLQTSVNDHGPSPLARTPRPATAYNTPTTPDPISLADSLRQLTPEGHLAKGISCHQDGELQKSTYHLRLAARGGNATAMLLYALACRHGWGMRANQAEGVSWLRKAVEHTGLEVADDENNEASSSSAPDTITGSSGGGNANFLAQKTHKAQLALAIYELGVSYMNGWGISQDKALALRCFEIAGSWGDGDAMAEAGFCYAKGVGCKKNLKRAADFYRRAEKKGVEMAGNSWIYKEKYMLPPPPAPPAVGEDNDRTRKSRGVDKESDREKKPRDKSRTRTFFSGRRKQQPPDIEP